MSFNQEKIDRSSDQSRRIFNRYVYRTDDTITDVGSPGYFSACRFAIIDGPATNSNGWHQGIVECHCSDGYVLGVMDGETGTLSGAFSYPTVITQADFLISSSLIDQVPSGIGIPLQISLGAPQSTPQFDLALDGTLTCNITGQYRFIFTAQTGRIGSGGVVNLFLRLLLNGNQVGNSVFSRLDNAATVIPLRFNLTIDLEAGDILTAQVVEDSSGVGGSGGLYSVQPLAAGWNRSPSASVSISQLSLVV